MTVESYLAEAGALGGLAGVLAGYSLAAIVQLLTAGNGRRLSSSTIVVFAAASALQDGYGRGQMESSPSFLP